MHHKIPQYLHAKNRTSTTTPLSDKCVCGEGTNKQNSLLAQEKHARNFPHLRHS